jgi:hypothetical protein
MPKLSLEYQAPGGQRGIFRPDVFSRCRAFTNSTRRTDVARQGNPYLKRKRGELRSGVRGKDARGTGGSAPSRCSWMTDRLRDRPGDVRGTYDNVAEFRSYGIEAERKWTLGGRTRRVSREPDARGGTGQRGRRLAPIPAIARWTVQGRSETTCGPVRRNSPSYIDDRPYNAAGGADGSSFLADLSLEWNSPVTKSGGITKSGSPAQRLRRSVRLHLAHRSISHGEDIRADVVDYVLTVTLGCAG